jgi:hypothetical protein
MLLARLFHACHHFPGCVHAVVRLIEATRTSRSMDDRAGGPAGETMPTGR